MCVFVCVVTVLGGIMYCIMCASEVLCCNIYRVNCIVFNILSHTLRRETNIRNYLKSNGTEKNQTQEKLLAQFRLNSTIILFTLCLK